jgi:hypothetical protein
MHKMHIFNIKNGEYFYWLNWINDQVKEDEMGRACSTNGREEECI